MNIKEKFLELTSRTYPHGYEHELINKLPPNLQLDEFGNLYLKIGEKPTTMFTCHLDTASHESVEVKHIIEGDIIGTDGTSILGADDKAGVIVLLYLMENNIPGIYYFFLGEERGCIGSKKVSSVHSKSPIEGINKVVSLDRRGYDSVITHQISGRSCSFDFAKNLSDKLNNLSLSIIDEKFNYAPDSTGIYTDSAQFVDIYSECTNISVGYHNEHSRSETQNIKHLENLCKVVVKINWDELETYRKPGKYVYDDDYYDYGYGMNYYGSSNKSYNTLEDDYFLGEETTTEVILDEKYYGFESTIKYDRKTSDILNVKLHPARIMEEKYTIDKMLSSLEIQYDNINWDGNNLTIQEMSSKDIILDRKEVEEYIDDINDWIKKELKLKEKNYI